MPKKYFYSFIFKEQMLQAAITDHFNPIVPKDYNKRVKIY